MRSSNISFGAFCIIVLIVLAIVVSCSFIINTHKEEVLNVTVTDKAVKRYKDKDVYLIFTDSGTFEVSDSLVGFIRFNSSDVYGSIEAGKTYNLKLRGYRVPIPSMYQNIESFEVVA